MYLHCQLPRLETFQPLDFKAKNIKILESGAQVVRALMINDAG
jgi:hypothetical protein